MLRADAPPGYDPTIDRLAIMEVIPEFSLVLCASQGSAAVKLVRIVKYVLRSRKDALFYNAIRLYTSQLLY